jgi:phosphopentomutase
VVTAKMKFITFDRPGSLTYKHIGNEEKETDDDVAREAAKTITEHRPQVTFVHFANVDIVGHASGWGSAQQVAAATKVDARVGTVLDALRAAKVFDETLIILSADHGGSGRGHGPDDTLSSMIPWIAAGPGVRKNFDLTLLRGDPVRTTDTFATACAVLGLPVPLETEGKAVKGAFAQEGSSPEVPQW